MTGGRNNQGVITARHRGGGHKRRYRLIDFRRNKDGVPAQGRLDPIRSEPQLRGSPCCTTSMARSGTSSLPTGLTAGAQVIERAGCSAVGRQLHAAEEHSAGNDGPQYRVAAGSRRAACAARPVLARRWWPARPIGPSSTLPSGEIRRVPAACRATIGMIGNTDHMNVVLGKAGRKRWLGRRPHVRGTAMNPIDHPHGGGEGRTKGGRHPVSPTGKSAKGGGTRKHRKPSNSAIIRRRRSRRYGQLKLV